MPKDLSPIPGNSQPGVYTSGSNETEQSRPLNRAIKESSEDEKSVVSEHMQRSRSAEDSYTEKAEQAKPFQLPKKLNFLSPKLIEKTDPEAPDEVYCSVDDEDFESHATLGKGQSNEVFIIKLKTGEEVVFKPDTQADGKPIKERSDAAFYGGINPDDPKAMARNAIIAWGAEQAGIPDSATPVVKGKFHNGEKELSGFFMVKAHGAPLRSAKHINKTPTPLALAANDKVQDLMNECAQTLLRTMKANFERKPENAGKEFKVTAAHEKQITSILTQLARQGDFKIQGKSIIPPGYKGLDIRGACMDIAGVRFRLGEPLQAFLFEQSSIEGTAQLKKEFIDLSWRILLFAEGDCNLTNIFYSEKGLTTIDVDVSSLKNVYLAEDEDGVYRLKLKADNEIAEGEFLNAAAMPMKTLPEVISLEMHNNIMNIKPSDIDQAYTAHGLSEEEADATIERLMVIKKHISSENCKKVGNLSDWDQPEIFGTFSDKFDACFRPKSQTF